MWPNTWNLNGKANRILPGKQVCPYSLPRLGRLCFTSAWGHTCCVHSKTDHTANIWNSHKSLLNHRLNPLVYSILPAVLKHSWHLVCTASALVPTGLFPREGLSLLGQSGGRQKSRSFPPAQKKTKLIIKLVPLQAAGESHIQIMVAYVRRDLCEHFPQLEVTSA